MGQCSVVTSVKVGVGRAKRGSMFSSYKCEGGSGRS